MTDWYRHKTWSTDIQEYFFQKLNRARKNTRPQYLKIQAIELVETQNYQLLDVAETLLNILIVDYPGDDFNRSSALKALGDIYRIRQNYDKAIDYYKQAVEFEVIYPQVKTQAYLYFAELVIVTQKIALYDVIEKLIQDRINQVLFPIEKYKGYSILAIVNAYNNNPEQAKRYKALAEQNANEKTSGLKYHKYLGIVKERDSRLDRLSKQE